MWHGVIREGDGRVWHIEGKGCGMRAWRVWHGVIREGGGCGMEGEGRCGMG